MTSSQDLADQPRAGWLAQIWHEVRSLTSYLEPKLPLGAAEDDKGDLLQGVTQQTPKQISGNGQDQAGLVVLRVETVNAFEAKIGAGVLAVASLLAYTALIILTVAKAVYNAKVGSILRASNRRRACTSRRKFRQSRDVLTGAWLL